MGGGVVRKKWDQKSSKGTGPPSHQLTPQDS